MVLLVWKWQLDPEICVGWGSKDNTWIEIFWALRCIWKRFVVHVSFSSQYQVCLPFQLCSCQVFMYGDQGVSNLNFFSKKAKITENILLLSLILAAPWPTTCSIFYKLKPTCRWNSGMSEVHFFKWSILMGSYIYLQQIFSILSLWTKICAFTKAVTSCNKDLSAENVSWLPFRCLYFLQI